MTEYNVRSERAEEFIHDGEIRATLEYAREHRADKALIEEILLKAEQGNGITHREAAVLIEVEDKDIEERMYAIARRLKERIYGNRIVMFAPLYLSNHCVNGCVYCPYHAQNRHIPRRKLTQEEIRREVIALQDMGHKRLALETGEHPKLSPIEYVLESIDTIYSIHHKNGAIRRVNVNIAATTVENYTRLKDAGIGTYILFEETYDRYIRQKRREGLTDFGITHVLLAAYVRGIAKYPQLNRFISGQKVFSRGDDIQYCMVIKKEMSVDSPDTSIKVHLNPRDTAEDVYHKLNAAVSRVKATQELDSNLDGLIMALNLVPGVFLKFTVWFLKLLDYFGMLPSFLTELSPFHGSLFFTSMGSLGIPPIYHHLYDFGNLPVFGAFGMKRRANELNNEGELVQRKYIDVKFVLDERIVDGYYYATFFKYYRRLLAHPEVLDNPPEEVVRDID